MSVADPVTRKMQPEATIRAEGAIGNVSRQWRSALIALALAWALLIIAAAREWGEMLHQWWNIETYSHILLIPFIVGWLAWMRRGELTKIEPRGWWLGMIAVALAGGLWAAGRMSGINLVGHAGAVAMLQAATLAILGPRATLILLLPLGFMAFLVPFGDEIIPPLQMITADIAIALTHWSGVEARIDGINIYTPGGWFIVAEACSGVRFLIAMLALGVLVCFTAFEKWSKRALFMLAAIIVPIIANGIRAWGTIYIAQSQGVEFAAGFDHIVYGWIFFAVVVVLVLAMFWRFFERDPEDAGLTAADVVRLPLDRFGNAAPIMPALAIAAAALGVSALALAGLLG